VTRTKVLLIAAPLCLAVGSLAAKVLVAPPAAQAATSHGLDTDQIQLASAKNLPSFDDAYQRHMGVLDTLR
jgi:hypothetical protein